MEKLFAIVSFYMRESFFGYLETIPKRSSLKVCEERECNITTVTLITFSLCDRLLCRLMFRFFLRKSKIKRGALVDFALCPHFAAVSVNETLNDRQADSRAFKFFVGMQAPENGK